MALINCILRNASMKLKVCPLQSLAATRQLLRISSVTASTHFHSIQCNSPLKQHVVTYQPGKLLQAVEKFSARQMSSGHDHTKIWTAEKGLSLALLGVLPAAFLFPCQPLDYLLAILVVMHNHWGVEAVVVDYVRPALFGSVIPKISIGAVYLMSIATLAGLFFFITNDVGIVNAIKMLWKL